MLPPKKLPPKIKPRPKHPKKKPQGSSPSGSGKPASSVASAPMGSIVNLKPTPLAEDAAKVDNLANDVKKKIQAEFMSKAEMQTLKDQITSDEAENKKLKITVKKLVSNEEKLQTVVGNKLKSASASVQQAAEKALERSSDLLLKLFSAENTKMKASAEKMSASLEDSSKQFTTSIKNMETQATKKFSKESKQLKQIAAWEKETESLLSATKKEQEAAINVAQQINKSSQQIEEKWKDMKAGMKRAIEEAVDAETESKTAKEMAGANRALLTQAKSQSEAAGLKAENNEASLTELSDEVRQLADVMAQ